MGFQLDLAFFGLTLNTISQHRLNLFNQIHEIVFHGKGGYTWETVYNMPVWLRKFTFNKIKDFYEEESKSYKKANSKSNTTSVIDSSGKVKMPEVAKQATSKRQSSYK